MIKALVINLFLFSSTLLAEPTEKVKGIKGFFDSLDPISGAVSGWCYDPKNPTASISVSIYMDDKLGASERNLLGSVTANVARPDLNKGGIEGNHAFSFNLPAKAKAVKPYALIHIFCSASKGGPKVELSLSPRAYREQP